MILPKKELWSRGSNLSKKTFLPLRDFRDRDDANRQLQEWIRAEAGHRIHGTTRQAPLTQFVEVEKSLLQRLPEAPPEISEWKRPKVHRDAHVQYAYCFYSVPFRLMGQQLWLRATDTTVRIYQEHELVATHPRNSDSRGGSFEGCRNSRPARVGTWVPA